MGWVLCLWGGGGGCRSGRGGVRGGLGMVGFFWGVRRGLWVVGVFGGQGFFARWLVCGGGFRVVFPMLYTIGY